MARFRASRNRQSIFLPGYRASSTCEGFTILGDPGHPELVFLQSLESAELYFLVAPVNLLRPDYQLQISDEDLELLGAEACGPAQGARDPVPGGRRGPHGQPALSYRDSHRVDARRAGDSS